MINNIQIPLLFRGDNIYRAGKSNHIKSYLTEGLFTNLINEGNPYYDIRTNLMDSIKKHIDGWDKSHFLSFTMLHDVALKYLRGHSEKEVFECYDNWEAAIFTINHNIFTEVISPMHGIYDCFFNREYRGQSYISKIMLIDVVAYLDFQFKGNDEFRDERDKANEDQEWLVFPVDPFHEGGADDRVAVELIDLESSYMYV